MNPEAWPGKIRFVHKKLWTNQIRPQFFVAKQRWVKKNMIRKSKFQSVVLPVALVLGTFGMMLWKSAILERGENEDQVNWLPETASDISFYRSHTWKVWECSMNENDFRKWASRSDLKEIVERQEIKRFSWWDFQKTRPKQYDETYFREEQKHIASVTNGLFASYRQNDGGGNYMVFDRDKNRVYFESNRR